MQYVGRLVAYQLALVFVAYFSLDIQGQPAGNLAAMEEPEICQTFDLRSIIARGDIHTRSYSAAPALGRYQGNGRFGCVFGKLGLHVAPARSDMHNAFGKTEFIHTAHFTRGKFGADYLLPLARIYWQQNPSSIIQYNQHQSLYDGILTTNFACEIGSVSIQSWFDPVCRDVCGFLIETSGDCLPIVIAPKQVLDVHYHQKMQQRFRADLTGDTWVADISYRQGRSRLFVQSNAHLENIASGLCITPQPDKTEILISVNQPITLSASASLEQTRKWWHSIWKTHAWLDLPDDNAQKMWVRSVAYLYSSYNDDSYAITPVNGLSGNAWPFTFPQDLSFIQPLLLATGRIDIAKAWIESWAGQVDGLKKYTKRIFNVDGICPPWVLPYGPFEDFHQPTVPNKFYYQIHNAGYFCRMAHETALMLNDPQWTEQFAKPVIRETAAFYKNIARRENDGFWHLYNPNSMGQDEFGGFGQKDYLCALFSAQYCFRTAIQHHLDDDGYMQAILQDGLAMDSLKMANGIYRSCRGTGLQDFGKQKHSPQLNPLAFLPLEQRPNEATRNAYQNRYHITDDAQTPHFHGWTLGQFLLAGSRMHDRQGWLYDWNNAITSENIDPEWMQIYESSRKPGQSFFMTSHALFAQSIMENIVSTWWGELEIGPCLTWTAPIRFGNFRTLLGVNVSGQIMQNNARVTFNAWKDCSFNCQGQTIDLKKGNEKTLILPVRRLPP